MQNMGLPEEASKSEQKLQCYHANTTNYKHMTTAIGTI